MTATVETHFLRDILPEDVHQWGMSVEKIQRRLIVVARRSGVTIHLIRDEDEWWRITKFKGGRIMGEKQTKKIPAKLTKEIERRRR